MAGFSKPLGRARVAAGQGRRFWGKHDLEDRSSGASSLIVVIAGHKRALSAYTLPRIARAVPLDDTDVCLVTPGVDSAELRGLAREYGWSYLSTVNGHVSLAQNLAIRAHPRASFIHKIDEDVFVAPGFFSALRAGHDRVKAEAEFLVGFAAPTLNVNGYSYVDYLRALGLEDEWRERFGDPRRAADGIPAQVDGEAAVFLWRHGHPVDAVAERFAERPFGYGIVPHRFSIGAIGFDRDLWADMNGFKRTEPAPGLGEDEQAICVRCLERSRIMAVIGNLYAGHFSFGPQTDAMMRAFGDRLESF